MDEARQPNLLLGRRRWSRDLDSHLLTGDSAVEIEFWKKKSRKKSGAVCRSDEHATQFAILPSIEGNLYTEKKLNGC